MNQTLTLQTVVFNHERLKCRAITTAVLTPIIHAIIINEAISNCNEIKDIYFWIIHAMNFDEIASLMIRSEEHTSELQSL